MAAEEFSVWVQEKGGDAQFISVLASFGFTSKLSLGNLCVESDECEQLLSRLNYGQRCLLQGLISACKAPEKQEDLYKESMQRVTHAVKLPKDKGLRVTLGELFNKKLGPQLPTDDAGPSHGQPNKRKGKYPMKGPIKKKVKEHRLRVVGLKKFCAKTPTGVVRESLTKNIWIRENANEEEVQGKILEAFNWSDEYKVQFMYAHGRNLRPATLQDVENCEGSWDAETIRALMGSGCLYVLRERQVVDISSDESIPPALTTADGISDGEHEVNDDDSDFLQSKSTFEASLQSLNEMFHMLPQDVVRKSLLNYGVNEAVDHLIHQVKATKSSESTRSRHEISQICSSSAACSSSTVIFDRNEPPSLQSLLQTHRSEVLNLSTEHVLSVDRSTAQKTWQSAVCFYKSAMTKPFKLCKELIVQFDATGEVGADSGALRREFFEDAIYQANLLLLEGEDDRRVFKKDWGMEFLVEIMGMLVAHSIMQEGPGIPCLSPCMYEYLMKRNCDECYPVKEDIPLNIATHSLITFIEELNDAHTQDQIDEVLDKPSNEFILSSSRWCITDTIVPANKLSFLQYLIHDEMLAKREKNIIAFCRGLDSLKVGSLIKRYPDVMKSLFTKQKDSMITAEIFFSLMSNNDAPKNENEERALKYFKEFVVHIETKKTSFVSLPALLRFITGSSAIPPLGLSMPIRVCYQCYDKIAMYPKAQACFSKLLLPVTHKNQDSFNMAFEKALEYGGGYGNL